jgi:hypothetical protein
MEVRMEQQNLVIEKRQTGQITKDEKKNLKVIKKLIIKEINGPGSRPRNWGLLPV